MKFIRLTKQFPYLIKNKLLVEIKEYIYELYFI